MAASTPAVTVTTCIGVAPTHAGAMLGYSRTDLPVQLTPTGQPIITGFNQQNLWFAQRYTLSGYLDPSYGQVGTAWPNLEAPNADTSGDSTVLGDGAVKSVSDPATGISRFYRVTAP